MKPSLESLRRGVAAFGVCFLAACSSRESDNNSPPGTGGSYADASTEAATTVSGGAGGFSGKGGEAGTPDGGSNDAPAGSGGQDAEGSDAKAEAAGSGGQDAEGPDGHAEAASDSPSDSESGAGGSGGAAQSCDECLLAECQDKLSNCAGDVDCGPLSLCISNCSGAETCMSNCKQKYWKGLPLYAEYGGCLMITCHDACFGADNCYFEFPGEQCNECAQTQCGTECRACDGNVQCMGLYTCVSDCPSDTQDCISACGKEFPGGAALYLAFSRDCLKPKCTDKCGQ